MTKWWLLLSALALWLVLGYALPRPPEADAQPGPGSRQGPDRIVSLAPRTRVDGSRAAAPTTPSILVKSRRVMVFIQVTLQLVS